MDTLFIAIIINLFLLAFFVGWILYHLTVWVYEYRHGPCFRGPLSEYKWPCMVTEELIWCEHRPILCVHTGWCCACINSFVEPEEECDHGDEYPNYCYEQYRICRCDQCGKITNCRVYYDHEVDVMALCKDCQP